ncbi:unnamed protein product [Allacma fusca]|uniref:Uncharacterized protein n=1 Tax=Allacma fusca TaxID=39272 RepID=A0A8J2KKA1_9HEXA|nr:unnamed protein product [Allacma fusca]
MFSLPPEVEMAERKYFNFDSIKDQCVATYVQQCPYKPLEHAGVFRKEEKKIQPIGLVSKFHQGELTGPNYDPEDMRQNGNDVVKLVSDLVELCADTSCQYINDFDLSGELLIGLLIHSVADRVAHSVAGRVTHSVADRVAHLVADQVAHSFAGVIYRVVDRFSKRIAH